MSARYLLKAGIFFEISQNVGQKEIKRDEISSLSLSLSFSFFFFFIRGEGKRRNEMEGNGWESRLIESCFLIHEPWREWIFRFML